MTLFGGEGSTVDGDKTGTEGSALVTSAVALAGGSPCVTSTSVRQQLVTEQLGHAGEQALAADARKPSRG